MNTKSWMMFGTLVLSATLPRTPVRADVGSPLFLVVANWAQIEDAPQELAQPKEATRENVSALLHRARAAMQAGDLAAAAESIEEADQMNVSQGVFHLGDTPKKARRDLEKLRVRAKTPPARPKSKAKAADTHLLNRNKRPVPSGLDDPQTVNAQPPVGHAARGADDQSIGAPGGPIPEELITAPPTDEAITSFSQIKPSEETATHPVRGQTGNPLWEARRALAAGDVRRAAALVEQAKRAPKTAGVAHDAPHKIEALIHKQQTLNEARVAGAEDPAQRREIADMAMEQAEGLIGWGDFEAAERLATRAAQMKVEYGPFEAQPAQLLERIQAAKSGQTAKGAPATLASPTPDSVQATTAPPADARPLTAAQVRQLTVQARTALQARDYAKAEKLAKQAISANLPDSQFASNADNPQFILLEVNKARGAAQSRRAAPANLASPTAASSSGVVHAGYNEPAAESRPTNPAPNGFEFPEDAPEDSPFGPSPPVTAGSPARGASAGTGSVGEMQLPGADAAIPDTGAGNPARVYLQRGEMELKKHDSNTALAYFRRAERNKQSLSPGEQARLAQHLIAAGQKRPDLAAAPPAESLDQNPQPLPPVESTPSEPDSTTTPGDAPVAAPAAAATNPAATPPPVSTSTAAPQNLPENLEPGALLNDVSAGQRMLEKKLILEVGKQQSQAIGLKESNPKQALVLLKQTRKSIENSGAQPLVRDQLLRRVERTTADVSAYLEAHRADIELEDRNRATKDEIDREQLVKVEVDERLAKLVNEYNKLMDEQRFPEAELAAQKAVELAPDNPLAQQLKTTAKLTRNLNAAKEIQGMKEDGFVLQLESVDESSTPFDDRNPYQFGDIKKWQDLTASRRKLAAGDRPRRSEREMQIERKLRTPISLQFESAALSEVINHLATLSGINIHIDPQGLMAEGVSTDTPVTINLKEDISLKSALNLILEPLHLGYVIKDEVLKITSEQYRSGEVIQVIYPVADLVIPIPNFVAGPRMGLSDSLHQAYSDLGYGGGGGFNNPSNLTYLASKDGSPGVGALNSNVLASVASPSTMAGSMLGGGSQPLGPGPGGAGGGVAPDFDSLIQLITSTIEPMKWDEVGGSGTIQEFSNNLSLVISQTEDVHDEIRDLLAQLRRLQDLQVTIEVRFITLNDNFFERIGVDFDFNINTNTDKKFQFFGQQNPDVPTAYTAPPTSGFFNSTPRNFTKPPNNSSQPNAVVGVTAPGVFSADLDIPFTQNSFGLAVPQFGGFDPTAGAQIGFAILSDIEAFFFINAAQGDRRTNVLQAPKVTLFNGQNATVSDTSQSPFVISVIPVVGDFAAAQQPVIVVLSEGTHMSVQATVSSDRRFVRLTIVPFFSNIGDVNTFTFEGTSTTRQSSQSNGPADSTTERSTDTQTTQSGTTVQLPTFAFVTVTTTVSVPDGGTVLLGGIKRLSEGRNETGTPILNKIPYVNRLFKNVGIGRQTQSLMMMVTPRIIIQEEEEALLGISPPKP